MDFFQAQQNAHTSSFRLLLMFGAAIVCLVLITDLLVYFIFAMGTADAGKTQAGGLPELDAGIFILISCVVVAVIIIGSLWKYRSLSSGGGRVVAESMGGRLLNAATENLQEKRLLNVVEEMAIASGMPVPQVYVLDDEAVINAFAAGLARGDAIIGVTRGTLETLTRDELQGVIAHEYSHILNGDMSLNIRLIGILHGILIMGIIGYYILRSSSRSRGKNSGGFLILGIGLMVIGYGGTFFGNLIKSSICRQREYLADASAVQFTRNPDGIAGALKKIGGMKNHSRLVNDNARELSHAYFSQGVRNYLGGLTATHPPLAARIRRIEPRWDGKFMDASRSRPAATEAVKAGRPAKQHSKAGVAVASSVVLQSVLHAIDHMGQPGEEEIATARSIIDAIPDDIVNAVHNPFGARAVIYCLVINRDAALRSRQLEQIRSKGDGGIHDLCVKYLPLIEQVPPRARLPLLNMALPALRELSLEQYRRFKMNLNALVAADARVDLFEWSLQKILYRHLDAAFFPSTPGTARYADFAGLEEDCRILFSVLAYAGHEAEDDAVAAFNAAAQILALTDLGILEKSAIRLSNLDQSLDRLLLLKPLLKRDLLQACLACAMSDNRMNISELELIRAIADSLDCPIPPVATEV